MDIRREPLEWDGAAYPCSFSAYGDRCEESAQEAISPDMYTYFQNNRATRAIFLHARAICPKHHETLESLVTD